MNGNTHKTGDLWPTLYTLVYLLCIYDIVYVISHTYQALLLFSIQHCKAGNGPGEEAN